jgi:site-specific DNA-methyltransferase (adenine-specific)
VSIPVETFADGRVTLHAGDCREVLATLADNSIDACVTDPPYSLVSILKRFGKDGAAPAQSVGATGVYMRASAGFMQCRWDTGEVSFNPEFWVQVLRVLKPGAHLLAMGGDRTFHRLVCAIEDAGFEIRHTLAWIYGSGFPKSHNVQKDLANIEWCTCDD